MCLGCSRVRESPCRVAGLVFRTKRTTASEPANNGPRSKPTLRSTAPTQTTHETPNTTSSAPAGAGGLCPPGPPRFIALVPIPERHNRNGTPASVTQASRLRSWSLARRSGRVSAWPCPPARPFSIVSAITADLATLRALSRKNKNQIPQIRKKSVEKQLTPFTLSGRCHPTFTIAGRRSSSDGRWSAWPSRQRGRRP